METRANERNEWHVVTCSDHRFAIGAWITFWSVFKYTPQNKTLRFHLLTTDPNAPAFVKMKALAKRWGMKLSIMGATTDSIEHLPATQRQPLVYTYLRLLVPGLLDGIDGFLYLDSDLLVRTSVAPLFEVLGDNTTAAAARDYYYDVLENGLKPTYSELNLAKDHPYFNAGIMVVNADAWRSRKVSERAMDYLVRYAAVAAHGDQDALNAVLAGDLKELDLSWNVQLGALEYFDRVGWPPEREALRVRKAELQSDPKIVHFIGPSKPWSDGFRMPYGKEYRKMIADSEWIPRNLVIPWKIGWLASTIRATVKRRLKR